MRYLVLSLIFPLYAVADDSVARCRDVKKMAEALEKQIQTSNLNPPDNCNGSATDYRCKDYSALETRLKSIQNELALFRGVFHVKAAVSDGSALKKNDASFAVESQKFYLNLKVASELEILLKSGDLLSSVAEAMKENNISDAEAFDKILLKSCKEHKIKGSIACEGKDPLVTNEIMSAIKVGSDSVGKFDSAQVEELTKALALKRGENTLTYSELLKDITNPGKSGLSDADLEKLKDVAGFFGESKFKFLPNIVGVLNPETPLKTFSKTVASLNDRHQFEIKSKLSWLLSQFKDSKAKLGPSDLKACEDVFQVDVSSGYESHLKACLDGLKADPALQTYQKSAIEDMKRELSSAGHQLVNLNQCIPNDSSVAADCNALTSERLSSLIDEETNLQNLQKEFLEKSKGLLSMRDYALEKLYSYECMHDTDSVIEVCTADDKISRESVVLSGEVDDILYVMDKPVKGNETVIDQLCADQEVVVPFKDKLCELKSIEEKEDSDARRKEQEAREKMAAINTAQFDVAIADAPKNRTFENIMGMAGQGLQNYLNRNNFQNPYTMIPPYPYPTQGNGQGIAGSLISPYSAVGGLGRYSPTPGLRPFSSLNSNVGQAHSYIPSPSTSFKSPIGW